MLADTGAQPSLIRYDVLLRIGYTRLIKTTDARIAGANSSSLDVVGQVTIPVKFLESIADAASVAAECAYAWTGMIDDPREMKEEPVLETDEESSRGVKKARNSVFQEDSEDHLITFLVVTDLCTEAILGMRAMRESGG
eukprot:TRINITY_DN296_c1_g1_i1.p1 TRINITY_DN296_c1_g1~~TRINITY_DN296_c1_g1_i1.p1  ORF type:complete len:139 (-),score=15.46 TRINITY_DN296_c1_g1_i1:38-454(-)